MKDVDKLLQACTVFGNTVLRRLLIDILLRDFPDTWEGWLNCEKQYSTVLVYERGVEFDALALCRTNNVSRCVPALLYKICAGYSQVCCILISGNVRLTYFTGRVYPRGSAIGQNRGAPTHERSIQVCYGKRKTLSPSARLYFQVVIFCCVAHCSLRGTRRVSSCWC